MRAIIVWILIGCLLVGCGDNRPEGATLVQSTKADPLNEKKVIVVLIDSMTKPVIEEGMKNGALPALSYLMERGSVSHDLVAPFPSMSVPIETTIITGTSLKEHKLPGLVWYDSEADTLIDYGSTLVKYWKLGMNDTLMNSLVHLNTNHISPQTETIYESLNQKGYSSGAVNMLAYRGDETHTITLPVYVKTLLHVNGKMETKGPDLLAFGQAVQPKVIQGKNVKDSLYQRFGLNDSFSAEVTETLIKEKQQPDFLMVFFPDYDKDAHTHGPVSIEHFANTDLHLQTILNAYESWEQALEENIFVVMGDHGQDLLKEKKEVAAIELEPLLDPLVVAPLLDEPSSGDVVIANNHRSAYLYPTTDVIHYTDIAERLQQDSRIDHLAWLEEEELILYQVGTEGVLRVKENGDWTDSYGQTWTIDGNHQIADITLNDNQTITFGDYPDIFHQLYSALNSHLSAMVVTARPGHVISSEGSPVHQGGGEHGGLHKNDTLTSIIISGTDKELEDHRMEALKEFFIELLEDQN
ncbi:alkaline phosphatase family protein [Halalkalibacter alkalisediminis]|uniref:Alkaline phosphatase family protein n=1 Tax=Halalkalibacter alkalisediminis TaxID=935616 RepID=A0ABV6NI29_9BACI|nr:alkaline phosphatase family protein [Halalkalibacter alkalisediminis]